MKIAITILLTFIYSRCNSQVLKSTVDANNTFKFELLKKVYVLILRAEE